MDKERDGVNEKVTKKQVEEGRFGVGRGHLQRSRRRVWDAIESKVGDSRIVKGT